MSTKLSEEHLPIVKALFVQACVNSMSVPTVVQLAGEHLTNKYQDMDETTFRDFVISGNSLEVWQQLTAQASNLQEASTEAEPEAEQE